MSDDFSKLLKDIRDDILILARKTLSDRLKEAQDDSRHLLDVMAVYLRKWSEQLASGELSKDDFDYHIKTQKDLLTLSALKRAGISKVRLDKFREDVFSIISTGLLKAAGL